MDCRLRGVSERDISVITSDRRLLSLFTESAVTLRDEVLKFACFSPRSWCRMRSTSTGSAVEDVFSWAKGKDSSSDLTLSDSFPEHVAPRHGPHGQRVGYQVRRMYARDSILVIVTYLILGDAVESSALSGNPFRLVSFGRLNQVPKGGIANLHQVLGRCPKVFRNSSLSDLYSSVSFRFLSVIKRTLRI